MNDISGLNMSDYDDLQTEHLMQKLIEEVALQRSQNEVLTQEVINQGKLTTEAREFGVKAHLIAGTIINAMQTDDMLTLEYVLEDFIKSNESLPGFFLDMASSMANIKLYTLEK